MVQNSKNTAGEWLPNPTPIPTQIEVSAPLKCWRVPHPVKICYQALKNKTNCPLREWKWFKDGLCTYSGGYKSISSGGFICSGGETRHSLNLDFWAKFDHVDLEGQGQSSKQCTGMCHSSPILNSCGLVMPYGNIDLVMDSCLTAPT